MSKKPYYHFPSHQNANTAQFAAFSKYKLQLIDHQMTTSKYYNATKENEKF